MVNNDSTYNFIKQGLNVSTVRGKAIANNIANINTAGYKKLEVSFEQALNNEENISLRRTNVKHIGSINSEENINVTRDESTSMRADGNNVDLDVEKVNQAANTLMYNALVTQANSKLSTSRYVITSGGN